jgi:hypothetical protein
MLLGMWSKVARGLWLSTQPAARGLSTDPIIQNTQRVIDERPSAFTIISAILQAQALSLNPIQNFEKKIL